MGFWSPADNHDEELLRGARYAEVETLPGCRPNKAICHGCRPNASHTLTHNLSLASVRPSRARGPLDRRWMLRQRRPRSSIFSSLSALAPARSSWQKRLFSSDSLRAVPHSKGTTAATGRPNLRGHSRSTFVRRNGGRFFRGFPIGSALFGHRIKRFPII